MKGGGIDLRQRAKKKKNKRIDFSPQMFKYHNAAV